MDFVEELENSIDIVNLVSRYTKLIKAGANYKSLCPFSGHNEKTPSFVVSPVKQLAYCFGCHRGGGPLKFVMDIEGVEFKEAITILANIIGKKIDGFGKGASKDYQLQKNIYSIFKDINFYYTKSLLKNKKALDYLYKRGITNKTIEKFGFGFSDSGLNLYHFLKEKGYNDSLIKETNVFLNISQKKDKFIGRITFPIKNIRGDIIAFTARIIDNGEPKYLNSPASKYYNKSEVLYGLYEAKKFIVEKDFVIIVEGQMDVIAMQEAGYTNTVAVSGTALTDKHLSLLKRLTHKLYLCFDGDSAGQKAIKLAIEKVKNKDFELKIIKLPDGKDPDEILKQNGDFDLFIKNALSPIAYYIKTSTYNLSSIEDKKKLLLELLNIIQYYTNSIEQDFYLKEVSKYLDLKESIVWDSFYRIKSKRRFSKNNEDENTFNKKNYSLEEIIIGYILYNENLIDIFKEKLLFQEYLGKDLKNILTTKDLSLKNLQLDKKELLKGLSLKIEIENKTVNKETFSKNIDNLIKQLNLHIYKNQTKILKEKMSLGDNEAFLKYSQIIKIAKEYNLK